MKWNLHLKQYKYIYICKNNAHYSYGKAFEPLPAYLNEDKPCVFANMQQVFE